MEIQRLQTYLERELGIETKSALGLETSLDRLAILTSAIGNQLMKRMTTPKKFRELVLEDLKQRARNLESNLHREDFDILNAEGITDKRVTEGATDYFRSLGYAIKEAGQIGICDYLDNSKLVKCQTFVFSRNNGKEEASLIGVRSPRQNILTLSAAYEPLLEDSI